MGTRIACRMQGRITQARFVEDHALHAVGGFRDRDDDDDRTSFRREEDGPSRADAADSWGGEKKFQPSGGGDDRYGSR